MEQQCTSVPVGKESLSLQTHEPQDLALRERGGEENIGVTKQADGHQDVVLRRAPLGEIVAKVPNGERVTILATEGENVKLAWNTVVGWAKCGNVMRHRSFENKVLERHVSSIFAGADGSPEAPALQEKSFRNEDVVNKDAPPEDQVAEIPEGDSPQEEGEYIDEAQNYFRDGSIRLISAMWLLKQGSKYRVQRLQDLPQEALLTPGEAANALIRGSSEDPSDVGLSVVAVSYRWLTAKHPDPDGVQLALVRAFLIQSLSLLIGMSAAMRDFGVFWDFMSLPQRPRSPAEFKLFTVALGGITYVFGSKNSITLQLIGDPDGSHPYSRSGWCRFEEAVSGIVKPQRRLLTLTQLDAQGEIKLEEHFKEDDLPRQRRRAIVMCDGWQPERAFLERLPVEIATALKAKIDGRFDFSVGSLHFRLYSEWNQLINGLTVHRKPPMHPHEMSRLLKSGEVRFTNNSDIDVVIQKYQTFFETVVRSLTTISFPPLQVRQLEYAKYDWPLGHFNNLGKSLRSFTMCKQVDLRGINLNDMEAAHVISEALSDMVALREVILFDLRFLCHNVKDEPSVVSALVQKLAPKGIRCRFAPLDP